MKIKLKKSLRIASLFLGLLFVFTNCQKEGVSESTPQETTEAVDQSPYKISTIGTLEVQQNEVLSSRLNALEGSLAAQRNNQNTSREVYSSTHDFYINTSVSKYVENQEGTYHSYTFSVRRPQDNGLMENLLVNSQEDGSYKLYLVSYDLTSEERSDLLEGMEVDIENKYVVIEIENDGLTNNLFGRFAPVSCVIVSIAHCGGSGNHANGMVNGNPCPAQVITEILYCTEIGGGDAGGDNYGGSTGNPNDQDGSNTGDNASGGGGGSGSGNSPTPNPIVSTPVVLTMAEQLSEFITLDDDYLEICINKPDNKEFGDQLRDYLLTENNNPNAESFGLAAIKAKCDGLNDLTLDEILELLEFEQDYRDKMSSSEIELFETLTRDKQLKYLLSAKEAIDKTDELFSTYCEKYNGKGDAFRHAYWNALSSSRIGVGLTNLLTTRHEDKPPTYPYNSKENVMDLYNNEIGRDIIWNGSTDILQDVLSAFNNGDLRYLSNQASDCRATYNSQLTPTNQ